MQLKDSLRSDPLMNSELTLTGTFSRSDKPTHRYSFGYNRIRRTFYPTDKYVPFSTILNGANVMIHSRLPIQCLEAVFLAIYFLFDVPKLTAIPVGFKSIGPSKSHKHIVLFLKHKKKFGSIGLSRKDTLGTKPIEFSSFSDVLYNFKKCYEDIGHQLKCVRIGLPIPPTIPPTREIVWKALKVDTLHSDPKTLSKLLDSFAKHASDISRRFYGRDTYSLPIPNPLPNKLRLIAYLPRRRYLTSFPRELESLPEKQPTHTRSASVPNIVTRRSPSTSNVAIFRKTPESHTRDLIETVKDEGEGLDHSHRLEPLSRTTPLPRPRNSGPVRKQHKVLTQTVKVVSTSEKQLEDIATKGQMDETEQHKQESTCLVTPFASPSKPVMTLQDRYSSLINSLLWPERYGEQALSTTRDTDSEPQLSTITPDVSPQSERFESMTTTVLVSEPITSECNEGEKSPTTNSPHSHPSSPAVSPPKHPLPSPHAHLANTQPSLHTEPLQFNALNPLNTKLVNRLEYSPLLASPASKRKMERSASVGRSLKTRLGTLKDSQQSTTTNQIASTSQLTIPKPTSLPVEMDKLNLPQVLSRQPSLGTLVQTHSSPQLELPSSRHLTMTPNRLLTQQARLKSGNQGLVEMNEVREGQKTSTTKLTDTSHQYPKSSPVTPPRTKLSSQKSHARSQKCPRQDDREDMDVTRTPTRQRSRAKEDGRGKDTHDFPPTEDDRHKPKQRKINASERKEPQKTKDHPQKQEDAKKEETKRGRKQTAENRLRTEKTHKSSPDKTKRAPQPSTDTSTDNQDKAKTSEPAKGTLTKTAKRLSSPMLLEKSPSSKPSHNPKKCPEKEKDMEEREMKGKEQKEEKERMEGREKKEGEEGGEVESEGSLSDSHSSNDGHRIVQAHLLPLTKEQVANWLRKKEDKEKKKGKSEK
ncbi:putative Vasohibin [Blattamonas nauphoetae]|uniref:Vasohibin n=1 Tax=Blattamonas nauphoetae TaxID=2049346 RepID=A0ABQ9Y8Z7_9EUKA|nr:putative Vasohibin [Blattamonas nauphoetae]